jgi:hypothetical protein
MNFQKLRELGTRFTTGLGRGDRMPDQPADPAHEKPGGPAAVRVDWLGLIRLLTQYVLPALIALVLLIEIVGWLFGAPMSSSFARAYFYVVLIVFVLLTAIMIGICGWIVFLWDLDRLFFKLEGKIDSQIVAAQSGEGEQDGTLRARAMDMLNNAVQGGRAIVVGAIEKAYWTDINAGGVLAFPKPDIAAAVDHIEKSRRDLLAPLTEVLSKAFPLGGFAAPIVARFMFRYFAPEIKVRLYRRLVLRFLAQLGTLFVLTALCFYISILAWSRINSSIFQQASVSATSVVFYQLDLMLRGALFDFMEHTHRSISPVTINQAFTAFVYYTLIFRMFVAAYVMSSLFRVVRFVLRRWRVLLR